MGSEDTEVEKVNVKEILDKQVKEAVTDAEKAIAKKEKMDRLRAKIRAIGRMNMILKTLK